MLNHDFINKLLKYDSVSYCSFCNYSTEQRPKYDRHLTTVKHKIAVSGIQCCGLSYYNKHQWINHKKSAKHRLGGGNNIPIESFKKPITKKTVNFVRKNVDKPSDTSDTHENTVVVPKQIVIKKKDNTNMIKKKDNPIKKKDSTIKKKDNTNVIKVDDVKTEDSVTKKSLVLTKKRDDHQVTGLLDIKVSAIRYDLAVDQGVTGFTQEVVPSVSVKRNIWKK
jgi:hypothetical protein